MWSIGNVHIWLTQLEELGGVRGGCTCELQGVGGMQLMGRWWRGLCMYVLES